MFLELPERVAVVTGAACGIGLAIADRLSQAGARVAVADAVKVDKTFVRGLDEDVEDGDSAHGRGACAYGESLSANMVLGGAVMLLMVYVARKQ